MMRESLLSAESMYALWVRCCSRSVRLRLFDSRHRAAFLLELLLCGTVAFVGCRKDGHNAKVDQPRTSGVDTGQPQASSVDRFVYYWRPFSRPDIEDAWTAYEVTSLSGRKLVMNWMSAHGDEIAECEEIGPGDWIPGHVFLELSSNKDVHVHHFMLKFRPAPKAHSDPVQVFRPEDIEALRDIFREHGVQVDVRVDPLRIDSTS